MDWPGPGAVSFEENAGAVTASSIGTNITASATVNVKGSYSELIASTARDAVGFWLFVSSAGAVATGLLDIAVGAASSEQIIVPNLLLQRIPSASGYVVFIPIAVPAGTRLSARMQSQTASLVIPILLLLESGTLREGPPLANMTDYGTATGDSGGTSIDPGGTANTKGSYVELVASTGKDIAALIVAFGSQANATRANATWLIDIAIGAAGSEQVILPNMFIRATAGGDDVAPVFIGPFYLQIPSGTRLAARAQCSDTDATDRLIDVAVYGIT